MTWLSGFSCWLSAEVKGTLQAGFVVKPALVFELSGCGVAWSPGRSVDQRDTWCLILSPLLDDYLQTVIQNNLEQARLKRSGTID